MTEAEWVSSYNSFLMLKACRRIIWRYPRKGRLFTAACCYRIWPMLADKRSREAVDIAASYADGLVSVHELTAAFDGAKAAHNDAFQVKGKLGASAEWAAQFSASLDPWFAASRASNFAYVAAGDKVLEPGPEHHAQAHLLRCIFGPLPFRSVTFEPPWLAWNNGSVVKLAQAIYDNGTFDRLPDLADALEQAGCKDADMLRHCRCPGAHVRGCWVVDLILGKT